MGHLREVFSSRELIANLVLREVRGQYKRTVLGRLWSLASPLSAMLVYTFVFAYIFRIQPDPGDPSGLDVFALWLLCGLLPWTFFATSVTAALGSIVDNSGLVTKVFFPRLVLPISAVLTKAYNWGFEMVVLGLALIVVGAFIWPWIPLVILAMVLLALFSMGLGFALAIANVHFRDTQYFVTVLMQIWMYLTPIVYPVSLVTALSDDVGGILGTPLRVMDLYQLNPLYHFVLIFRSLLYDNTWPDAANVLGALAWTVVALGLGYWVFIRNEKRLAEAL